MKNKNLALVLATALVLGACGNQAAKPKEETKQEESQTTENKGVKEVENTKKDHDENSLIDADRDPIPQVATNPEEAVKIFHEHKFGDGAVGAINISKLKLSFFNEALDYEIEGFKDGKEYKLKIADNGKIVEEEIDEDDDTNKLALDFDKIIPATDNGKIVEEEIDEDDDTNKLALDFDKIIPATEAMEKALKGQAKNAWVVEYELEIDDGRAVYDIDIENGRDVKIDAATGEIIK